MNSVELNHIEELLAQNEDCAEETPADHLLSLDSPDTDDIYGDTPIVPRLGDQYQAEIPPLLSESDRLHHSPINSDDMLGAGYSFGVGLAIPIMWVFQVGDKIKHEKEEFLGTTIGAETDVSMEFMNKKGSLIGPKCSSVTGYPPVSSSGHNTLPQGTAYKVEFPNEPLEHGQESARITRKEYSASDDHMHMDYSWLQLKKAKGYIPLPGSPIASWSDAERQSFLLGLYIFGKNLAQVKKFMGSKEVGDVLSFYYGEFYRSDTHRKWSDSRKIKGRRCIHGQRLFTGWRQQELLSRMLPCIPQEVYNNLLEAAKSLSDGRSCLEEFVFTLKAMVGLEILVEAVGIGKGKHDLTSTVLDPSRSNQVPTRPEIPVGKACSSLSSGDIIKVLTGDFRLSKAKSNDLFWEAVWPRLLARGWHSEQPKDLNSAGSRNALVFLIPGIKKFSRAKLTKGNHYFDSVSDVLNKVASDPRLLELEGEGANGSNIYKDECGWDVGAKSNHNGQSDQQRHCYLRPRLTNCNSELVKFTVVDTSLVQGEGPSRVRELRSLPMDVTHNYRSSDSSGETDSSNSDELPDYDVSPDNQVKSGPVIFDDKKLGNSKKCMVGKGMESDPSDHLVSISKQRLALNGHDSKDQCYEVLNDKQLMKDTKCQYSRRVKSGERNHLAPMSKRQRLTACEHAGTGQRSYSFSRGHHLKKEDAHGKQKSVEVNENTGAEVGASRGKSATSSSAKGSLDEGSECNSDAICTGAVNETIHSQEKPRASNLIDLNIPPFPPDFDAGDPFCMEMAGSQDVLNTKEPSFASETKLQSNGPEVFDSSNGVPSVQQPTTNARRQSTRNRPPTARALEALACGFLSTRRKGRGTKVPSSNDLASRPSRQTHRAVGSPVPYPTTNLGIAGPNTNPNAAVPNVGVNEEHGSNMKHAIMSDESHAWSEGKEDHELLRVLYCSEVLD